MIYWPPPPSQNNSFSPANNTNTENTEANCLFQKECLISSCILQSKVFLHFLELVYFYLYETSIDSLHLKFFLSCKCFSLFFYKTKTPTNSNIVQLFLVLVRIFEIAKNQIC